ncbi:hypothetical protein EXE58_14980 [Nocardioides seonyuensis]|uniref:Uncharacterized protein n=1 Tax=Nocardioides seonyuensis TaxID=2518371 RepID=A0A4P7IH04_9ACTN|nr:hypothetical protein [Nocardioides seonyuensis]QBX56639.1 hypothetical protein EXE58_14980 [Nocardioides seonyuensis]
MRRRGSSPGVEVPKGEKVLASTTAADGAVLAGTRDAFYLVRPGEQPVRVPWEQVEAAEWDRDAELFRLSEVGRWGELRREHTVTLDDTGRLLELVQERVTASIVLQKHVPLEGRRGLRVIARRAPRGDRPVEWVYEYDQGVDPEDPAVASAARAALAQAQQDLGTA